MPKYQGDPRWITTKFDSKCSRCSQPIKRGEEGFYYPNGRKMLCKANACGEQASREFACAAQDETY